MTKLEYGRLEHAKRQYFVRINDTPVVILVDDRDDDIMAGCFEVASHGSFDIKEDAAHVPISLKPIKDETVLGYATFMLMGILEQIKKEHGQRK